MAHKTGISLCTLLMGALNSAFGQQGTIEEVVVTASKRPERMQDVPLSVNAITGSEMQELGIDNFDEYVQFLSNVVSSGRGPGRSEIFMRGVGTEQTSLAVSSVQSTSPSVAVYLDDQPVAFAGRNLDVYAADLERVEVLPGPQGTLYGASSQTGTLRLITNKPQHGDFETGVDASFGATKGGETSAAVRAFLNLPLSKKLAFRLASYSDSAGGWIDNRHGRFTPNIEVLNRNQISSLAAICTGKPSVDHASCAGRARVASADNSEIAERDFNDSSYLGARIGASYVPSDDWDLLVQYTRQSMSAEGVFEYDPVLAQESVKRFTASENEDEFGLMSWTLSGRLRELEVLYTGGYLERDVFYLQDYTGYTVGGGYQVYYICTGGYSHADKCLDPTKQLHEITSNERLTNEFRFNTDPDRRWRLTAGVFADRQKTISDGETVYPNALALGFNVRSAPGTITEPANSPPTDSNVVSRVEGVSDPFGRGPHTLFVNNYTRKNSQLAFFGELSLDFTPQLAITLGARRYDLDFEFTGATGSSFGCKGSATPCDGQSFDNRVSLKLESLGAYAGTGDIAHLSDAFSESNAQLIAEGVASGTFFLDGLDADGTINQSDTIFRMAMNWTPTDEFMLFAVLSEGFRPQTANRNAGKPSANQSGPYRGYLVPAIVRTDKLENFEFGMKGTFLDRTLRVNATAYWSEITNLQLSRVDQANVAFLFFVENGGDAESNGLDIDFTWLVTPRFSLHGGFSFVDNELTRVNPQLEEVVAPPGSRLPWAPEYRANLRARYDFPDINLISLRTDAYVRGSVTYTGESPSEFSGDAYLVEDVTRLVFGRRSGLEIQEEGGFFGAALSGDDLAIVSDPSFIGRDANGEARWKAARYVQQAYSLVNFAVGLAAEAWSVELFVDNVFDKNAELNVNAIDYTPTVTTNRPRTVGFRFIYQGG